MPQIPSATNRERYANNRFTLSYTVQLSAAEGACCIIRVETPINRERTPSSFYASHSPTLPHEHQLEGLQNPVYFRVTTVLSLAWVWIRVLITSKGQVTKPESAPATSPLTRKAEKFYRQRDARRLPGFPTDSRRSSSSRSSRRARPRWECSSEWW